MEMSGRKSGRAEGFFRRFSGMAIRIGVMVAAGYYRPFAFLFGFRDYERNHGGWPEYAICAGVFLVTSVVWSLTFGKSGFRAEMRETRKNLLDGQIRPVSFSARMTFLLGSLLILIIALIDSGRAGAHHDGFLPLATGLFSLFVLVEVSRLMFPGDSMLYNPDDELQSFLQFRSMKTAYVTSVIVLFVLFVIAVLMPSLLLFACPVGLTVTLIVPAVTYYRLDLQADLPR